MPGAGKSTAVNEALEKHSGTILSKYALVERGSLSSALKRKMFSMASMLLGYKRIFFSKRTWQDFGTHFQRIIRVGTKIH